MAKNIGSTTPRLNYIVWCHLPQADGTPGETIRPALVRGTKHDRLSGRAAVYVCFGSGNLDKNNCRHSDLVIQDVRRLDQLDLPVAVRFDLSRWIWVPWAAEFFGPPEHSPHMVAGPLSETEKGRLRNLLQNRGMALPM